MRVKWGHLFLIVLLCAACFFGPAIPVEAAKETKSVDLKILAINDLHGQLNVTSNIGGEAAGRADVLAAYLKKREKE